LVRELGGDERGEKGRDFNGGERRGGILTEGRGGETF